MFKLDLTIVLQKWGIVMQPKPIQDNKNRAVADALLEDLTNAEQISHANNAEEYIFQEIAKIVIAYKALLDKTQDVKIVLSSLVKDVEARRQLGINKYGIELKPHNGRDTALDLYEELLDAAFYAKCLVMEKHG